MGSTLLSRTNDTMFKSIFGNIKHQSIIKDFLQSAIDLPKDEFEKIELIDPNVRIDHFGGKTGILDLKLETKNQKVINLEIQVAETEFMTNRIIFYLSGLIKEQLNKGEYYDKLRKVICLLITVNHNMIKTDNDYVHLYRLNDLEHKHTFSDLLEIKVLELPKLPKKDDNSKLWEWLTFLKTNDEKELETLASGNTAIADAVYVLKELSADEKLREQVTMEEMYMRDTIALQNYKFGKGKELGIKEGMEKGIEKGKKLGIKEGVNVGEKREKIKIAKNLINLNIDTNSIAQATGLTIEEIEKYKNVV